MSAITPFPYPVGHKCRRVVRKPELYKGWTIWRYQVWCEQTYSPKTGEWRDMAMACKGEERLLEPGRLYIEIDAREASGK